MSFWGDLDLEGLRIFLRLQKILPQLTLSALYEPMLMSVKTPETSHPYSKVTAKNNQSERDIPSQNPALSILVNACKNRAVDQEQVTQDNIVGMSFRRFREDLVQDDN